MLPKLRACSSYLLGNTLCHLENVKLIYCICTRTIITRKMKVAPLDLALQLSETLGVPLEVWLGVENYIPAEVSADAFEVARAYDCASLKIKKVIRLLLDLGQLKEETV